MQSRLKAFDVNHTKPLYPEENCDLQTHGSPCQKRIGNRIHNYLKSLIFYSRWNWVEKKRCFESKKWSVDWTVKKWLPYRSMIAYDCLFICNLRVPPPLLSGFVRKQYEILLVKNIIFEIYILDNYVFLIAWK